MDALTQTRGALLSSAAMALAFVVAGCGRSPAPPAAPPPARPEPPSIALAETRAFPLPAHLESADLAAGKYSFEQVFDAGSALFHARFNGLDGVGVARRKDGTVVARFEPIGTRGPTAQACDECHNFPVAAGAGLAHSSVSRDKSNSGKPPFDGRSVPSLLGNGILQLLAQEMTEELQALRAEAGKAAQAAPGTRVTRELRSKGTDFGSIGAVATAAGTVTFDVSHVSGIDPDLVVRPMGWKGDAPRVRDIVAFASAGAMGMQPEEIVWSVPGGDQLRDLDGDGVSRELSVGDVTAMTIYNAAQETPTDLAHLVADGYARRPAPEDEHRIQAGREAFTAIGCASCHTPEMSLANTRFEEPTARGNGFYYDQPLAKKDPGYDPGRPAAFDVLKDAQLPRAEPKPGGGAIVRLFGDLKRHAMGRQLADKSGDSTSAGADLADLKYEGKLVKIPADQFLTAELWGVGNTGPWLHDNRAGTLREAVLLHGEDAPPPAGRPGRSEAQEARDAFKARPAADQDAIITFLLSLRTFSPEPEPRR